MATSSSSTRADNDVHAADEMDPSLPPWGIAVVVLGGVVVVVVVVCLLRKRALESRSAALDSSKNTKIKNGKPNPVRLYSISMESGFELSALHHALNVRSEPHTTHTNHLSTFSSPNSDSKQNDKRGQTKNEYDEPWPDLIGQLLINASSPKDKSPGKDSFGTQNDGYEAATTRGQFFNQNAEEIADDGTRMTEAEFFTTVARYFESSTKDRPPSDDNAEFNSELRGGGHIGEQLSSFQTTRPRRVFSERAQRYAVTRNVSARKASLDGVQGRYSAVPRAAEHLQEHSQNTYKRKMSSEDVHPSAVTGNAYVRKLSLENDSGATEHFREHPKKAYSSEYAEPFAVTENAYVRKPSLTNGSRATEQFQEHHQNAFSRNTSSEYAVPCVVPENACVRKLSSETTCERKTCSEVAQPYAVTGILLPPAMPIQSLPNDYHTLGRKDSGSKNTQTAPEKHYDHADCAEKQFFSLDRERGRRGSQQTNEAMATNVYAHLRNTEDRGRRNMAYRHDDEWI